MAAERPDGLDDLGGLAYAYLQAALHGQLPDVMSVEGRGFDAMVAEQLSLLVRSKVTRLQAELADQHGIPFSRVQAEWSDDDLAMVAALRALRAAEELKRCPQCGVDPGEVQDPETHRALAHGDLKIVVDDCWFCSQVARAQKIVTPELREQGYRVRVAHREWGDPFMDLPDGAEE